MAEDLGPELKKQLVALLDGGQAHATFEQAVKDFPPHLRGVLAEGLPYSAWQLLEHMRIAQHDILEFSAPPAGGYRARKWPDDYWPKQASPTPEMWDETIAAIRADLESFKALIQSPEADLQQPFPWGTGQNLMREAMLIADHTAYHVGELVMLRRLLGAWKK